MSAFPNTPPFNSAVLFSGGGLRFGYYLGMYQALCDNGKRPDIILASCGGAFVAGLLELAPDPQQALQLMLSHDFYRMLCRITPNPPKRPTDYVLPALGRWLASQTGRVVKKLPIPLPVIEKTLPHFSSNLSQHIITTLTKQSLAVIADESEDNPLWQFANDFVDGHSNNVKSNIVKSNKINSIILASQLVKIQKNYQWQLLLRCNTPALAMVLGQLNLDNHMATYNRQRIHADHAIITDMPLAMAVRASISDMFYLPPLLWGERVLMGGVLNLTPIELACQLANTLYAETKSGYDKFLAEPAIHSVFGFSANERLGDVRNYQTTDSQIHWLDTADNAQQIRPAIAKKLRLTQGYLDVIRPDFATFQTIMQSQFEFGYYRAQKYLDNLCIII